jgi:hypothetical protein
LYRSGNGYLCTHDPRLHVGLGEFSSLAELRIAWPGQPAISLKNVPSGNLPPVYDR